MKAARIPFAFFLIGAVLLTARGLVQAQTADVQFFPETGHSIRGDFLEYYNRVNNPKLVFGYPITEQMVSRDGKTVQYFQRARFEMVNDASGAPRLQLTALGQALYSPGRPQTIINPQACKFIDATGFPLCLQFLDFFQTNGGLAQFGQPISPLELHNDTLVQYFQNARLEWRTDGFNGRIVPTDLGRIYFDSLGEDPALRNPVEPLDAAINPVLTLKIRAYVSKPVTRPSGDQAVIVIVRSQTNQAVANANVVITAVLPDGTTRVFNLTTDARGMAQISFDFSRQTAGEMVPIKIRVDYHDLSAQTQTSFRIWF